MSCKRSLPRAKRIDLRHKSIKGKGSAGEKRRKKKRKKKEVRVNFSASPFTGKISIDFALY